MLNTFVYNLENYGNAEYYVRDYDYPNTVFKYVLKIDVNKINLKKYWCVYEECNFNEKNPDYLNSPLKYQEYVNDLFSENLAEIILSSMDDNNFCTHIFSLDNDNGKQITVFLNLILKNILGNFETVKLYFEKDDETLYQYIINYINEYIFQSKKIIDANPLYIDEVINNFQNYLSLKKRDYKKISKTITCDDYEAVIRKLKL